MFHVDVAYESSFQSPKIEEYSLQTLPMRNPVFVVSLQQFDILQACFQLVTNM